MVSGVSRCGSILPIGVGLCSLFLPQVISLHSANDGATETQQSCSSGICQATTHDSKCGVWLALSTLPGAGIGMFSGKGFAEGEVLMAAGDHIVPIVETDILHDPDFVFLWDQYTWVRLCIRTR